MKLQTIEGITKHGYRFLITCGYLGQKMIHATLTIPKTRDEKGETFILKPDLREIEMVQREMSTKGYLSHASSFTAFA